MSSASRAATGLMALLAALNLAPTAAAADAAAAGKPAPAAFATARAVRTLARWVRKSAAAWVSLVGDVPSAAFCAAAVIASTAAV